VRINGPLLARATGVGREGELAEEEKKYTVGWVGAPWRSLAATVVARNTEARVIAAEESYVTQSN
jgi:hypothetical protein